MKAISLSLVLAACGTPFVPPEVTIIELLDEIARLKKIAGES